MRLIGPGLMNGGAPTSTLAPRYLSGCPDLRERCQPTATARQPPSMTLAIQGHLRQVRLLRNL